MKKKIKLKMTNTGRKIQPIHDDLITKNSAIIKKKNKPQRKIVKKLIKLISSFVLFTFSVFLRFYASGEERRFIVLRREFVGSTLGKCPRVFPDVSANPCAV